MHVYAFGSVCRGDIGPGMDIDLLAIVDGHDHRFDPDTFSIYSYKRIREIWEAGNPFAWHLSLEGRLLFSADGSDFFQTLGSPRPYCHYVLDCEKFLALFRKACDALRVRRTSRVFEISIVFLSVRNIATCFSLGATKLPDFSRESAFRLGDQNIPIMREAFHLMERARLLATRGYGERLGSSEVEVVLGQLDPIGAWMEVLVSRAKDHEQIQQPH